MSSIVLRRVVILRELEVLFARKLLQRCVVAMFNISLGLVVVFFVSLSVYNSLTNG